MADDGAITVQFGTEAVRGATTCGLRVTKDVCAHLRGTNASTRPTRKARHFGERLKLLVSQEAVP